MHTAAAHDNILLAPQERLAITVGINETTAIGIGSEIMRDIGILHSEASFENVFRREKYLSFNDVLANLAGRTFIIIRFV